MRAETNGIKGPPVKRRALSPFKRLAHALVDDLPVDATWQDLAKRVQLEIELEEAVGEFERRLPKDQRNAGTSARRD